MDWFRSYIGTATDPKFMVVAKKSGARLGDVLAVWQMLLERACGADERGRVDGFDCEGVDALLDLEEGAGCKIYAAMEAKGLIVKGCIAAWDKRQPKREREDSSTERVRAFRERKKSVFHGGNDDETPCNATKRTETPRVEEIREELNTVLAAEAATTTGEAPGEDTDQGRGDEPRADLCRDGTPTAYVVTVQGGGQVRISEGQVAEWEKSFSAISVRAELQRLQTWSQETEDHERWGKKQAFMAACGALAKKNQTALAVVAKPKPTGRIPAYI